ncbi:MAG TPA: helix-turn-helix domain-containing protein [Pseudonocardia sp.]|uniref:winged helix-turn-helix transcriptional regulator n=1 Tax=Pseudonocardia sp. TaxID=60912 RepID=UPI002CAF6A52|nr:helix-turn-helix domain-containing protein [Pseudonocardia sp.]HTF47571.1 helix-turn-helix domain-containing protein [Pseudonocardia sp.]
MRRTSFGQMHCSIAQTLDVVGEWWSPLILRDIYMGLHRFDDIAQNLEISRNLLTRRLTDLVTHGILERRKYQDRPARYGYHLTESGRELVPALLLLMAWGDRRATPPGGPPVRLIHRDCGEEFTPTASCSHCGGSVGADDITLLPGPGAAEGPGTRLLHRRAAPTPP